MPKGDRTGPRGQGPRTGRGMGGTGSGSSGGGGGGGRGGCCSFEGTCPSV